MAYRAPFEIPQMSYEESLAALHEIVKIGISPMLETVEDMLACLGDPDCCFESLQVVGTNGKTSTSRYTAALLREAGLRVALYTSPELVHYTERMEIDGRPVTEEQFARGISAALEAGRRVNEARTAAGERPYDITEFDLLTVGACLIYAEAGVDVAVLECGMGGRWDATSAVKSIRGVAITGIGMDHMHILGNTIEEIAQEKAATIKKGRFCILGAGTATPASAEDVFLARCEEQDVKPILVRPLYLEDFPTPPVGEVRKHPDLMWVRYRVVGQPKGLEGTLKLEVETPYSYYEDLSCRKPAYQAGNIACATVFAEQYLAQCFLEDAPDTASARQELLASRPVRPIDEDGVEIDEPVADALLSARFGKPVLFNADYVFDRWEFSFSYEVIARAIANCPTPGRFDVVRAEPLALIDAAHNPQSVEAFLDAIRGFEPDVARRPTLLAAVLADKDVPGIVALLAPEFPRVVCTQTTSARALAADELAKLFAQAGNAPIAVYPSVAGATEALADEAFVACGSITLAGEVAGILRG